jgi:hypothetical protein
MFFQEFDKWQIGIFVCPFEHMAEIADGLVGMNQQDEMKAFWHGTILLLNIIPCDATFQIQEMIKMSERALFLDAWNQPRRHRQGGRGD